MLKSTSNFDVPIRWFALINLPFTLEIHNLIGLVEQHFSLLTKIEYKSVKIDDKFIYFFI